MRHDEDFDVDAVADVPISTAVTIPEAETIEMGGFAFNPDLGIVVSGGGSPKRGTGLDNLREQ
jgi:hypothetical protein